MEGRKEYELGRTLADSFFDAAPVHIRLFRKYLMTPCKMWRSSGPTSYSEQMEA